MKEYTFSNKVWQLLLCKTILIMFCGVFLCGCATNGNKNAALKNNAAIVSLPARPLAAKEISSVALLLPLSGNWAAASSVIRNGFLAAYYYQQAQAKKGEGEKKAAVNVKVIDTAGKDIAAIYREAVAAGVDVIVGPLTKQEVEALAAIGGQQGLPVPTLALNTLSDYQSHPLVNLYQFGLSPQDEAQQAAIRMLQDGYRNIAVVMPDNEWGRAIAAALSRELEKHGGKVVGTLEYHEGQDDLDSKVRQLLSIGDDDLQPNKVPSAYHGDIQAVFLIAEAPSARQLAPLFRFYTQSSLPLYATSHIYGGFVRASVDKDLDGISFCDVPWAVTNPIELDAAQKDIRNKINTLWPDSLRNNARLYALGVDAYNVAVNINDLLRSPHTSIDGATGQLTLDDYNHVARQLTWTVMQHGIPRGL